MATKYWLDQNGTWSDGSNWTAGTAPVSDDVVYILKGSQNILAGLSQGAITGLDIYIGPEFMGSLGSPGSPLVLGNTDVLRVDAPSAKQLCFSFTGATLTQCNVENTNNLPYGLALMAGTFTDVYVADCGQIYLGGGTFTSTYFAPSLNGYLFAHPSTTLTTFIQSGGRVNSEKIVGTLLEIQAGTFDWTGSSGGTMPVVTVQNGGKLLWRSPGSVITLLHVKGGEVDGSVDANPKTLANANVYRNGFLNLDNKLRNFVVSNNIKRYGGQILGTNAITDYMIGGQGVQGGPH